MLRMLVRVVPNNVQTTHLVPPEVQQMIEKIERDGDHIAITLTDGAFLKTFPSRQHYRNYYYCFRDKLPRHYAPESYQGCNDVRFRYLGGSAKIDRMVRRGMFEYSETSSIIECGAYNGWKAVGFAKHVGPKGTLLVLEIDPAQCQLAVENVERNVPDKRTLVWNTGIWSGVEEREYTFEAYASHSLLAPLEHDHFTQKGKIVTDTLDNIIDKSEVETFDFLNVQTGGSELEALQGLSRNLNRVKVIYAGTHYHTPTSVSSRYLSAKHLLECDCEVFMDGNRVVSASDIPEDSLGGIWAITPASRGSIVPRDAGSAERGD